MVAPGGLVAEDPARPLAAPSWKVLPMPTVMYPWSLKYSGIVVKLPEMFRQSGRARGERFAVSAELWLPGSSGNRSQLYSSKTRVVGGCRLVKIDAREGEQVAMVT